MIILDCEQGSEEWFEARCGIPTASCFDKILTSTGKKSTQAKSYRYKLVAEYFTKEKVSAEQNEWMQRGVEMEAEARQYYEFMTSNKVQEVGLIYKNEDKLVSCSPDGLREDRGLEIKCPAPHTHVEYLLNDKLPTKYIMQVQGSMWVSGLDKWDFLSYHPAMPHLLITVEKDEALHEALDVALDAFIKTMLSEREQLEFRLANG